MKCNSIQMLCLYSSPYSMYSDHVFCSDHYDLSFYFSAITLMTSVCPVLLWSCVSVHMTVFVFLMWVHDPSVHLCVCVSVCVSLCCRTTHHAPPPHQSPRR